MPCAHAAMVIWVVGEGVWRWRRGDRVLSVVHQDWVLGDVREEFSSRTIGGTLAGELVWFFAFASEVLALIWGLSDMLMVDVFVL